MTPAGPGPILVCSRGIRRIRNLPSFLGRDVVFVRHQAEGGAGAAAVAVWGKRATALPAEAFARRAGIAVILRLEDGFLRSIGLGVERAQPLSLVVDDLGIYYDASQPSRLEVLIAEGTMDAELMAAACRAMDLVKQHRLSKYNKAPLLTLAPRSGKRRVLVIDQTAEDMSILLGGCDASTFGNMLDAARTEHPDAEIWIKTHPDVISGKKKGNLTTQAQDARVHLLAQDGCPLGLLGQFDHIYVATSQLGFEALMLGKPVTVFGKPWYAGWGLTDDRHADMESLRARRPSPRRLEELFAAAYLQYARYIHPATGAPGSLFELIDWLARNKAINDESRGTHVCVGMSLWKRSVIKPFLGTPSSRLRFVRRLDGHQLAMLPKDTRIVLWGNRFPELARQAAVLGIPVLRVEDGFVRSIGLGSNLHAPLSLAIDGPGIYYDPFSGSRLERLLTEVELDDAQQQRALLLRETLLRNRISKYNVGRAFRPARASAGRKIILVPGQVEDDASVLAGSPVVSSNLELLRVTRSANPAAWIIYKPHPDVVSGNRRGAVLPEDIRELADEVAEEANIGDCIAAADEVHTMTSLTGFEALLHGKVVHCHGGPFYAGWGLTVDHFALPHRQRRLSLDQLVYAALCLYPRYRLPGVDGFCSVEDVVQHLASIRPGSTSRLESTWFAKQLRKARQLIRVVATVRG
ncbi:capsular polysaccharide biosynthesis protein [Cupriavidus sp. AU9028]|uniref:capsular polysaccharide biosynthesis protein n=1 Tax=Cupriavidus sp. AU9028 TaxID=2871157 RepID=UPI001C94847C|nr:capsular polysaccharide biosynthesis protein [Cupriavidus sp. AU9028]